MKTDYTFITTWRIHAPIEKVWDAIFNSREWPFWWKGVVAVKPVKIDTEHQGVGSVAEYTWKSTLPYTLTFTTTLAKVTRYKELIGQATGELEGTGVWKFSEKDGITTVVYEWRVNMKKPLLKALSPICRPIFIWNHNRLMEQGKVGLTRLLDSK
jgi:uncharacterized protein YndB with AHSA1/START domain